MSLNDDDAAFIKDIAKKFDKAVAETSLPLKGGTSEARLEKARERARELLHSWNGKRIPNGSLDPIIEEYVSDITKFILTETESLREENAALREALELYALGENWDGDRLRGDLKDYGDIRRKDSYYEDVYKPSGKRAREVLARFPKPEKERKE